MSDELAAEIAPPCPSCGKPLAEDKIVCTNCNYSRRLGRKLSAKMEVPPAKPERTKKVKTKVAKADDGQLRPQRSSLNGGKILTGLGMMVGAVVWFVLGLFLLNRIFFYPPILLIVGIGTLINGLLGKD